MTAPEIKPIKVTEYSFVLIGLISGVVILFFFIYIR